MNYRKTVWIDLFVNGTHSIEEYGEEDGKQRLFELIHNGWAVSASIFCEEDNRLYVTVYRPNGDSI